MSYIGTNKIGKMFLGDTEINKAYLGSNLVYQNKPYDIEIEYLESTGHEYIDTNIGTNQNLQVEIKWKNATTQTSKYLFGGGSSTTNCIRAYISTSGNWRFGGASVGIATTDTALRTAIMNKENIVFNSSVINYNGTVGTFSSSTTIKIFAGPTATSPIKARIYYFKIFEGENLILNLVPVRVGNVGYMYDKVSGQLFGNSGTGNFVLGPDKTI